MASLDELEISLREQLCIEGFPEDAQREFVAALEVKTADQKTMLVTSNGVKVQFVFDSEGNFHGAFAQIANMAIPLLFGTGSSNLQVFKGSPSATNPGPGWETEVELTQRHLGQSGDENTWTIFFASRKGILNTFSS